MTAPWPPGAGVLTLPDGRRVRGRGLRRPPPDGEPRPDRAYYLTARRPAPTPWPATWIPWPDFALPLRPRVAAHLLAHAYEQAARERVEIACGGGRGRTGTALACFLVLAGLPPADAVRYVRERYDRAAVETPWQRGYVRWFAAWAARRRTPPSQTR